MMDNFKAIYRILRYLEKTMGCEVDERFISAETLKLSERKWAAIMEMIAESGYVKGISVARSVSGEVLISFSIPRITLRGLEYLQESSLMRKAANLAKGIAEMIP